MINHVLILHAMPIFSFTGLILELTVELRIIVACRQMTVMLFSVLGDIFQQNFHYFFPKYEFSQCISAIKEFFPDDRNECWSIAKVSLWVPLVGSLFLWVMVSLNYRIISAIVTSDPFCSSSQSSSPLHRFSPCIYRFRIHSVVFTVSNNLLLPCKYT